MEQQVEGAHVGFVSLAGLSQRQQGEHTREVPVLGRAVVDQVRDERRVEETLRVLPERVSRVLGVSGGVGDEALHDGQHVHVGAHVCQGVVMARGLHPDEVEVADPVACGLEHPPCGFYERSLRVGYQVAGVHLHQQRKHVAPGLARSGCSDDADVAVAVRFQVEVGPGDGDPDGACQRDVQVRLVLVHERFALFYAAPTGGAVLLAEPEGPPSESLVHPDAPDGACCQHARQRCESVRAHDPSAR